MHTWKHKQTVQLASLFWNLHYLSRQTGVTCAQTTLPPLRADLYLKIHVFSFQFLAELFQLLQYFLCKSFVQMFFVAITLQ